MYFNVYLFQNKSTGSHEVDFVLGKKMVWLQNLMSPNGVGGGGGLIEEGALLQKNDFQRGGGLSERGGLIARWGLIDILR